MRLGLLGAILCATIGTVSADEPSACLEFFDPGARGGAKDVFLSIERIEGKHACFLIPRSVIDRRFRDSYTDRFALQKMLMFEPGDLSAYARRGEIRNVDTDCLDGTVPSVVAIASRTIATPTTIKEVLSFSKEIESDLAGYHRYTTDLHDYYAANSATDTEVGFFCWRKIHAGLCVLASDYEGMTLVLQYQKGAMAAVEPRKAMQCLRSIVQAFRVTKPIQTN
jgi:hypothetical protein